MNFTECKRCSLQMSMASFSQACAVCGSSWPPGFGPFSQAASDRQASGSQAPQPADDSSLPLQWSKECFPRMRKGRLAGQPRWIQKGVSHRWGKGVIIGWGAEGHHVRLLQ